MNCMALLNSMTNVRQLNQILAVFFTNGSRYSNFQSTNLLKFCSSSSQMDLASSIFRQIPNSDSFVWTAMIKGFADNGPQHQSMLYFVEMCRTGIRPNFLTYPFVLKACSNLKALLEGEQVHTHAVKFGFKSDIYVSNCLIDLYTKCGYIENAHNVYDEMVERDVISHTSMIYGYFSIGDLFMARSVFEQVEEADVVLWTAMISGHTQNGAPNEALELFDQMQNVGVRPNLFTMVSVVSACSQSGDYEMGKWAHQFMVESGMPMNVIALTSLTDMYISCGYINEALIIFDKMQGNVAIWSSLVNGYANNGYAKEALEVYKQMENLGLEPNEVTFLSVLSSCAQLGALEKGKEMECSLIKMGMRSHLSVGTALVDMYTKCGSLVDANQVFRRIYPRDVVIWSAMINGYAANGHFKEAMSLFGGLLKDGVKPNHVTFLGLLIACSHGGLIHEGYELFDSMVRNYAISPIMEHYGCMVDLLGRAGKLEAAKMFIDDMPMSPGISVWSSLLGASATHNNAEIGEFAARQLAVLDTQNVGNFVSLSNIYASKSRWVDVESARVTMNHHGAHKTPGYSWIEVEGNIHEFLAADREHPQFHHLYDILINLSGQLRLAGECSFCEYVFS